MKKNYIFKKFFRLTSLSIIYINILLQRLLLSFSDPQRGHHVDRKTSKSQLRLSLKVIRK